jgi:hypothetical protein
MDVDAFLAAREQLKTATTHIQEVMPGWPFVATVPPSKIQELAEALWAEERASEKMREALSQ